jgi:hypothetical protein
MIKLPSLKLFSAKKRKFMVLGVLEIRVEAGNGRGEIQKLMQESR